MTTLVTATRQYIARSLKTLIPLIQRDLKDAMSAGLPHYLAAGEKLLEARPQLTHGSWGRWLNRNFSLSERTARRYMRAAEQVREKTDTSGRSLLELTGETARRRERRASHRAVFTAADRVDGDSLRQERQ